MIHVETVDLTPLGIILPSDRIGMVIAQPYLSLTATEPFHSTAQSRPLHLQVLSETLEVARATRHGAPKTHFTIFPEYSIPGLLGITLIETALRRADWPSGTVVIGGTDALSKADFEALAGEPRTYLDTNHNSLDNIQLNEWINCGIIWVKGADGEVKRWLQPKLFPACLELNVQYQQMYRGKSVFTFKGLFDNGTQFHFCTLICFDWIAAHDHQKAWHYVLDALKQQVAPGVISLSWFFVIQRNPIPSHDTFLSEVRGFFDQTIIPNVIRNNTCLVFSNGAGKAAPGRIDQYGGTSLIFAPQAQFTEPTCASTFSTGGLRFRSSRLLNGYKDIFFRERGACIHSFAQINPGSLAAGPAGRQFAVDNAFVFPFLGTNDCRAPSAAVPAPVKWLNDELDDLPLLSANYQYAPLSVLSNDKHLQIVTALRATSPQSISNAIRLATQLSSAQHADEWDRHETEALQHILHTLDIISIGFDPLSVVDVPAHATMIMNGKTIDVLAIRGNSHEECIEHSKQFSPLPRRQVLLVSRDRDNSPWIRRFGSFLQTTTAQQGQERKITDTTSVSLHIGYQKLLNIFQHSTTVVEVQGAINAELTT